jgi:hypothetical protein
MAKKILFIAFFVLNATSLFSQSTVRSIIVSRNGLSEHIEPPIVLDSTKLNPLSAYKFILAEDSINSQLLSIEYTKYPGDKANLFLNARMLPKSSFIYKNYEQTGVQNFWDENGVLIKREFWEKGKKVKTVYYKSVEIKTVKNNRR